MKAIRFMQPEVIEYSEIPAPQVKDNEVLAKIAYAGFCATDIELLTGEMVHIKNGNTKYPIIPGHEWSGTIVEVGKNVRDFKVGDRITIHVNDDYSYDVIVRAIEKAKDDGSVPLSSF